jgi:paraquat-inducible protein A
MRVEIGSLTNSSRIGSGIKGLEAQDLSPLALLVLGVTIVAPLYRIIAMIYVLAGLRFKRKPPWLIPVFSLSERLRSWAMLDVFLLGAIVTLSKLHDLAATTVGIGFWALGLAVLALAFLDSHFRHWPGLLTKLGASMPSI